MVDFIRYSSKLSRVKVRRCEQTVLIVGENCVKTQNRPLKNHFLLLQELTFTLLSFEEYLMKSTIVGTTIQDGFCHCWSTFVDFYFYCCTNWNDFTFIISGRLKIRFYIIFSLKRRFFRHCISVFKFGAFYFQELF
jgi:hypothetical protein